jgi:hypothetical protein
MCRRISPRLEFRDRLQAMALLPFLHCKRIALNQVANRCLLHRKALVVDDA